MRRERSPRNLPKFCKCCVSARQGPAVGAPGVRVWINLCRFDGSAPYLETLPPSDADYFVGNARVSTAVPALVVDCRVSLAGNLPVGEAVTPKLLWQWFVGIAFPATSLSASARRMRRTGCWVPDRPRAAFCFWLCHHEDCTTSLATFALLFGLYSPARLRKRWTSLIGIINRPRSEMGFTQPR